MKTVVKLFAVALMSAFALETDAQGTVIQGGLNLSKLMSFENDYYDDVKRTAGFQVGVLFETPINDKGLVIAPGIFFSSKGGKETFEDTFFDYQEEVVYTLYYLEVPIIFKRYFNIGNVRCYGGLGPYVGFATHGKFKWEESFMGETNSGTDNIEWDELDNMNRFELGGLACLGVELNQFQLGVQYSNGLLHFGEGLDQDEQFLNSVISITAAYRIPRKK